MKNSPSGASRQENISRASNDVANTVFPLAMIVFCSLVLMQQTAQFRKIGVLRDRVATLEEIAVASSKTQAPVADATSAEPDAVKADSFGGYVIAGCTLRKNEEVIDANMCPAALALAGAEARIMSFDEGAGTLAVMIPMGDAAKVVKYDLSTKSTVPGAEIGLDGVQTSTRGRYGVALEGSGKYDTLAFLDLNEVRKTGGNAKLPAGMTYSGGETTFGGPFIAVTWIDDATAEVSAFSVAVPRGTTDVSPIEINAVPVAKTVVHFDRVNWNGKNPL